MASRRPCVNHPDSFCYICGKFTPKSQTLNITSKVAIAYKHYFGCQVGDQDKSWAPHIRCRNCYVSMTQWLIGKRKSMPFVVPMVWREPTNHFSNCYFCLTKVLGHSKKSKSKIVYRDCPSALRPVAHAPKNIPVPSLPSQLELRADEICESATTSAHFEVLSESSGTDTAQSVDDFFSLIPHLLDLSDLNHLVRDLGLTKNSLNFSPYD